MRCNLSLFRQSFSHVNWFKSLCWATWEIWSKILSKSRSYPQISSCRFVDHSKTPLSIWAHGSPAAYKPIFRHKRRTRCWKLCKLLWRKSRRRSLLKKINRFQIPAQATWTTSSSATGTRYTSRCLCRRQSGSARPQGASTCRTRQSPLWEFPNCMTYSWRRFRLSLTQKRVSTQSRQRSMSRR